MNFLRPSGLLGASFGAIGDCPHVRKSHRPGGNPLFQSAFGTLAVFGGTLKGMPLEPCRAMLFRSTMFESSTKNHVPAWLAAVAARPIPIERLHQSGTVAIAPIIRGQRPRPHDSPKCGRMPTAPRWGCATLGLPHFRPPRLRCKGDDTQTARLIPGIHLVTLRFDQVKP